MSCYAYPHTIDNGAGERITFLRRVEGANGNRLEGENVALPGAGPPMHLHRHQNVEYPLTEMFASAKRRGGAQPDTFDVAFLAQRYRSEHQVMAVPPAVQRIVFPVLVAVGHLLGKYRRYGDAPEPVRRGDHGQASHDLSD